MEVELDPLGDSAHPFAPDQNHVTGTRTAQQGAVYRKPEALRGDEPILQNTAWVAAQSHDNSRPSEDESYRHFKWSTSQEIKVDTTFRHQCVAFMKHKWLPLLIFVACVLLFIMGNIANIQQAQQQATRPPSGVLDRSAWFIFTVEWPSFTGAFFPSGFNASVYNEPVENLYVQIELSLKNAQPDSTGGTVDLGIRVVLPPGFQDLNTFPVKPSHTIEMAIDENRIAVSPLQPTVTFTKTLNLDSGSISLYPFDTYEKTVELELAFYDNTSIVGDNTFGVTPRLLNAFVKVDRSDPGFFSVDNLEYRAPVIPTVNTATARRNVVLPAFRFHLRRPEITIIYPVLVGVLFWLIIVAEILYILPFLMGTSKQPFDNPTLFSGLLFAVPSVRTSLPGNIPIGSAIDMLAFYWAMMFSAVLFLHSVLHFYADNRKALRPQHCPKKVDLALYWMQRQPRGTPVPYYKGQLDVEALVKFWSQTSALDKTL